LLKICRRLRCKDSSVWTVVSLSECILMICKVAIYSTLVARNTLIVPSCYTLVYVLRQKRLRSTDNGRSALVRR
jgi:hypothetical protein